MINFDPQVEIFQGDILAVRGSGWLSDGIARAEYGDKLGKVEPRFSATHVGLFLAPGNDTSIAIDIEALNRVKTNVLRTSTASVIHAYVLHDISLTDIQRSTLLEVACSFSAADYGYLDLGAQWLDATFKTNWWTGWLTSYLAHRPICSYVVAAAYAAIRLDFGVADSSCRPSDIMTFASAHPELYQVTQIK